MIWNTGEDACGAGQGSVLALGCWREPPERFGDTDGMVSWKSPVALGLEQRQ